MTDTDTLSPCPFCGRPPEMSERAGNIGRTEFFCALACFYDGYSACAHQMAICKTAEQAKHEAIAAWNRRTPAPASQPVAERCSSCDDTGDVHGFDGGWRGRCHCPAGTATPAGVPLTDEQIAAWLVRALKSGEYPVIARIVPFSEELWRLAIKFAANHGITAAQNGGQHG